MNIVISARSSFHQVDREKNNFVVETALLLTRQNPEHHFILLANPSFPPELAFPSNTEIRIVKPSSKGILLKGYWQRVKLPVTLKKLNADVLLSYDGSCALRSSVSQCLIIYPEDSTKSKSLNRAGSLVVTSQSAKKELASRYKIPAEKISVAYGAAGALYLPISENENRLVKEKYSDGREFFLYNGGRLSQENFITLLKAFSHFKKRQQSSMQLLLLSNPIKSFRKSLENYKYRNDVKIIPVSDEEQRALIIASAYAIVLPGDDKLQIMAALQSMQSGVPVIASKDSVLTEMASDAFLHADITQAKDLGEKMMQLYTAENFRAGLIEKGKGITSRYTWQKAADIIWQSVLKTLP